MQNIQKLVQATANARRSLRPARTVNREGAPTFHRSLREQTVQVLTTGTLGDTFYVSGKDLAAEALEVLIEARETCPEFLARALVWARERGFMKAVPVLGLVVLSGGRGRTKAHFEAAFPRVIRTPDDLRAFVALCRSRVVPGRNGLGGVALDAVRNHLGTLSEYHAVKYGSAASRGVSLRDVIRMAHPRPESPALAERFGWLVGGVDKLGSDPAINPQIRAFEALKAAATEEEQIALIRQGRLPYEAVVPSLKATTPAIWSELLRQTPYFNLLRNLVAFTRHGVFANEENVRYAVRKLADPRAIERAKVLPFRFFDAWRRCKETDGHDGRIADALREALERSFVAMPTLGDRVVAIGTDVSGSMSSGTISPKSSTRYIDIAGIFTGALLRRIEGRAIPLPFDTRAYPDCGLSPRDEILVTAEKIARYGGGGTAVGSPVEHLLRRKARVDVFIGITDNVDWAHGDGYPCSGGFLDLWLRYRNEVAPDARAYLVTIAPYREVVAPPGTKGARFIYGWSDAVPAFIGRDLESGASQVEEIERMPFTTVQGNLSQVEGLALAAAPEGAPEAHEDDAGADEAEAES